jgi:signal transduction histidine kinase
MSSADHKPDNSAAPRPQAGPAGHGAEVAHELANLLDGSLRNMGLIMSSLREPTAPTPGREEEDSLRRLEVVNQGLRQMATLIHRWMVQPADPRALHHQNRTLGEVIGETVNLLRPLAEAQRIEFCICVGDEATRLPAGPLGPVVGNALRNSMEAIDPQAGGRIELIAMVENGQLELRVRDNGVGVSPGLLDAQGRFQPGTTTKPNGHGLGLSLVREIALSLGGSLELANRPPHGAVLTFRCPLASLTGSP